MDFEYIEQLLERYWQCQTTVEEEKQLRIFFTEDDVPQHLIKYKSLFQYQQMQQHIGLSNDFDARVLEQIEAPVVKAKRLTLASRLSPLLKAAAVVAVVVWLGNVAQHTVYSSQEVAVATDTIGKQITTPSVALSGDAANAQEKQRLDSLKRIEKKVDMK